MIDPRWHRAIVIGASSGIGEALARQLASRGTDVALVARREDRLRNIATDLARTATGKAFAFPHDVSDIERVPTLFKEITQTLGGLDLVIYAAGVLPTVGPEEYDTGKDMVTIATNFGGAIAWLNQTANRFSRASEGTIIGISSVAGDRGRVGNPVYNASKAALSSYLESLQNRLTRRGVRVLTVKPGYVRTALLGKASSLLTPSISPESAAEQILNAAAKGSGTVYVPGWWRPIMMITRLIPGPVLRRLNF